MLMMILTISLVRELKGETNDGDDDNNNNGEMIDDND